MMIKFNKKIKIALILLVLVLFPVIWHYAIGPRDISESAEMSQQKIYYMGHEYSCVGWMNLLYDAIKHFKVADEEALVHLHADLRHKLNAIDFGDDDVARLEKDAKVLARALKEKAEALTATRRKAAEEFASRLVETARPLGDRKSTRLNSSHLA